MARIRLSTTVEADLIDEALRALLVGHRAAEVDASYAALEVAVDCQS